jgi:hypothetical protein
MHRGEPVSSWDSLNAQNRDRGSLCPRFKAILGNSGILGNFAYWQCIFASKQGEIRTEENRFQVGIPKMIKIESEGPSVPDSRQFWAIRAT